MTFRVAVKVENHGHRALSVVAANISAEGQLQSGAFAHQQFAAGLRTFIVAVVSESIDDAIQTAGWNQDMNSVTRAVPPTAASQN